ncbi:MAG TPA: class II aldolase/adducin family protein [Novosphingobium sp.]|nr:class II aldolase/adducin family protein [Novosphingobium sp.]
MTAPRHLASATRRGLLGWLGGAGLALVMQDWAVPLQAQTLTTPDDRAPLVVALDDLVAANRILANESVIDAFGHVSCRHPLRAGHFLMSRARAPALVEAADLMEFDGDGKPIDPAGRRPYIERFIHAAIYAARPDVRAVVHDHSVEIIPFGLSTTPLRALSHVGGIIGGPVPVWDIAEFVGPRSNLLVTSMAIGTSLARKLGTNPVVLLRGHGAVAVGRSIRQATIAAVNLNAQARIMQNTIALGGGVHALSPEEIAETAKIFSDETPGDAIGRTWEYWCARAGVPFHAKGA